jgi:hypothetical protein
MISLSVGKTAGRDRARVGVIKKGFCAMANKASGKLTGLADISSRLLGKLIDGSSTIFRWLLANLGVWHAKAT